MIAEGKERKFVKTLKNDCYNFAFSHIYVEKRVAQHPRVLRLLERFSKARIIWIDHYKDVFCRSHQSFAKQKCAQSLILAAKEGQLIYQGAKVCQSFQNEWFYYTSCVMNCIYDCEYCYLRGMYASAYMVLFVNLEDIFEKLEELLQEHPVYLCVSYDTDLAATEAVFGYVREWIAFAKKHPALTIELRTKSGNTKIWKEANPQGAVGEKDGNDRIIAAYTLSPQPVIDACEHRTANLQERLRAASAAWQNGFAVRFCFDPMIYLRGWKEIYQPFFEEVFREFPAERLKDVSLGGFRISSNYLKKMRRQAPNSAVVQFPFESRRSVYRYPEALEKEMLEFARNMISKYIQREKIFEEENA